MAEPQPIVARSHPLSRNRMAQVCRRVCGERFFWRGTGSAGWRRRCAVERGGGRRLGEVLPWGPGKTGSSAHRLVRRGSRAARPRSAGERGGALLPPLPWQAGGPAASGRRGGAVPSTRRRAARSAPRGPAGRGRGGRSQRERSGLASSASTSAGVGSPPARVGPLGRDGQHPLDDRGVLGMAQRGEAEQRPARRPAGRCAAARVTAVRSRWSRNAPMTGRRGRRGPARRGRCPWCPARSKQQPEAVAVGGDGVRAGVLLRHEPLGEERFQSRRDRAHRCASVRLEPRRRPGPSSSGEEVRYQYVDAGFTWPSTLTAAAAARRRRRRRVPETRARTARVAEVVQPWPAARRSG